MEIVPDRSALSLIPLITTHVAAGSTIISDEWAAYGTLGNINNYTHMTVNHSVNFVDPVTGANTQKIESSWRALKRMFLKGGFKKEHLTQCLTEYVWRRECEQHGDDVFKQLIYDISQMYRH